MGFALAGNTTPGYPSQWRDNPSHWTTDLLVDLRAQLQTALADRYRVERELGRGGMATVFLAQDLRHDRPAG